MGRRKHTRENVYKGIKGLPLWIKNIRYYSLAPVFRYFLCNGRKGWNSHQTMGKIYKEIKAFSYKRKKLLLF